MFAIVCFLLFEPNTLPFMIMHMFLNNVIHDSWYTLLMVKWQNSQKKQRSRLCWKKGFLLYVSCYLSLIRCHIWLCIMFLNNMIHDHWSCKCFFMVKRQNSEKKEQNLETLLKKKFLLYVSCYSNLICFHSWLCIYFAYGQMTKKGTKRRDFC